MAGNESFTHVLAQSSTLRWLAMLVRGAKWAPRVLNLPYSNADLEPAVEMLLGTSFIWPKPNEGATPPKIDVHGE